MFKSRTVWTAIAIIIINGVPAIRETFPTDYLPYIDCLLGFLAIYFRVNTRQKLK